jgi:hypothetical protein
MTGRGTKDQMMDVLEKYLMTEKVFEMQGSHRKAQDGCPNNAAQFGNNNEKNIPAPAQVALDAKSADIATEGDEDQVFTPKLLRFVSGMTGMEILPLSSTLRLLSRCQRRMRYVQRLLAGQVILLGWSKALLMPD